MTAFNIEKRTTPKRVNPKLTLFYGGKKAGKTTMLGKLNNCLLVDTEKGAEMIPGTICEVDSIKGMRELLAHLASEAKKGNNYDHIAIDTINNVVKWIEKDIVDEYNETARVPIEFYGDLSYGKGHTMVRDRVDALLNAYMNVTQSLILIGHNKIATVVGDNSNIIEPESLDLVGKLRNMIMAKCDTIGYVFRDIEDDETLKVSFKDNGALEAGSRCEHLKGKVFKFEWKNIFFNGSLGENIITEPSENGVTAEQAEVA